jgi:hypothetical protein
MWLMNSFTSGRFKSMAAAGSMPIASSAAQMLNSAAQARSFEPIA